MNIYKNKEGIFISDKINHLKYQLNKDSIDMRKVKDTIKELDEAYTKEECDYIESLLNPKDFKGAKLPSKYATPSTTFQLHNFLTFRITNGMQGNDVFVFSPFTMYSEDIRGYKIHTTGISGQVRSAFVSHITNQYWFKTASNLDGMHEISGNWNTANAAEMYAPEVYSKYRVVSACMELKYMGPIDYVSGNLGAGINFEQFKYLSATGYDANGDLVFDPNRATIFTTYNPQLVKYTNFELIRDSPFHKENSCLDGIRLLYFPTSNKDLEFRQIIHKKDVSFQEEEGKFTLTLKNQSMLPAFNWFVYMQNCPMSSERYYRLDYWINFECIPRPKFLDYIPLTLNVFNVPADLFKKVQEEMEKKAIQNLNNI